MNETTKKVLIIVVVVVAVAAAVFSGVSTMAPQGKQEGETIDLRDEKGRTPKQQMMDSMKTQNAGEATGVEAGQ